MLPWGVKVPTQVSAQNAVPVKEQKRSFEGKNHSIHSPNPLVIIATTNAILELLMALVETTLPITYTLF